MWAAAAALMVLSSVGNARADYESCVEDCKQSYPCREGGKGCLGKETLHKTRYWACNKKCDVFKAAVGFVCDRSPVTKAICDAIPKAKECASKAVAAGKQLPGVLAQLAKTAVKTLLGGKSDSDMQDFKRQVSDALSECGRWASETAFSVVKAMCGENETCKSFMQLLADNGIDGSNWKDNISKILRLALRMAVPKGESKTLSAGIEAQADVGVSVKGSRSISAEISRENDDDVYTVNVTSSQAGAVGVGKSGGSASGSAMVGGSKAGTMTLTINAANERDWKELLMLGGGMFIDTFVRKLSPLGGIALDVVNWIAEKVRGKPLPWDKKFMSRLGIVTGSGTEVCLTAELAGKIDLKKYVQLDLSGKGSICVNYAFDKGARTLALSFQRGLEGSASASLGPEGEEKLKKVKESLKSVEGKLKKISAWMAKKIKRKFKEKAKDWGEKLTNITKAVGGAFGGAMTLTYKNVDWPKDGIGASPFDLVKVIGTRIPSFSEKYTFSATIGDSSGGTTTGLLELTSECEGLLAKIGLAAGFAIGPHGMFANLLINAAASKTFNYTLKTTNSQSKDKEGKLVKVSVGFSGSRTIDSGKWSLGQLLNGQLPVSGQAAEGETIDEAAITIDENATAEGGAEGQGGEGGAANPQGCEMCAVTAALGADRDECIKRCLQTQEEVRKKKEQQRREKAWVDEINRRGGPYKEMAKLAEQLKWKFGKKCILKARAKKAKEVIPVLERLQWGDFNNRPEEEVRKYLEQAPAALEWCRSGKFELPGAAPAEAPAQASGKTPAPAKTPPAAPGVKQVALAPGKQPAASPKTPAPAASNGPAAEISGASTGETNAIAILEGQGGGKRSDTPECLLGRYKSDYLAAVAKPARELTNPEARTVLTFLYFAGLIEVRTNGAKKVPSVAKDCAMKWASDNERVDLGPWVKFATEPSAIRPANEKAEAGRVGFVYNPLIKRVGVARWDRKDVKKAISWATKMQMKMAVGLYRLTDHLAREYGVTELHHAGIQEDRTPCDEHCDGRGIDIAGVSGLRGSDYFEFFVYHDWGTKPVPSDRRESGWPAHEWKHTNGITSYRLAEARQKGEPGAKLFYDLFRYAHSQFTTTGPATLGETLQDRISAGGTIMYPDHLTTSPAKSPGGKVPPNGREAHINHIHLPIDKAASR
jgi:hypothetical protein